VPNARLNGEGTETGAHERKEKDWERERTLDWHDGGVLDEQGGGPTVHTCALLLITAASEVPVMRNEWRKRK
jgi:hypothetical protein